MNKLIGLMALVCVYVSGFGQQKKTLHIGDTVPEITFNHIINYKTATARLSDFKDKLVILDFWATWCGSCLESFPAIYKLQNRFNDSVRILLVNSLSTKDSYDKIEKFISRRKAAYFFPIIALDTVLSHLFPHSYIPYYVWLFRNRVCAITDEGSITEENIQQALAGNFGNIHQIKKVAYDFRYPLFENGNGGEPPSYIFKSFLTPCVNGLNSTMHIQTTDSGLVTRLTFTNTSLLNLFRYAYPAFKGITEARMILNFKDTTYFSWKEEAEKQFNYEADFPARSEKNAKKLMQNDLQKYFCYKVSSAEKGMTCWVLKAPDKNKAIDFPKGLKHETNLFEDSGLPIYFNNYQLSALVNKLETIYNQPFLDETNIKQPVTLSLPAHLKDIKVLTKSLARQGISLTKELRKIRVIILSNKKSQH